MHAPNRAATLAAALPRTYGTTPPRRLHRRTRIKLRADLGWTTVRAYLAFGWIFDLRGTLR